MEAEITITVSTFITIVLYVVALLGACSLGLSYISWKHGFYDCKKIYDPSAPKSYKDWVRGGKMND